MAQEARLQRDRVRRVQSSREGSEGAGEVGRGKGTRRGRETAADGAVECGDPRSSNSPPSGIDWRGLQTDANIPYSKTTEKRRLKRWAPVVLRRERKGRIAKVRCRWESSF